MPASRASFSSGNRPACRMLCGRVKPHCLAETGVVHRESWLETKSTVGRQPAEAEHLPLLKGTALHVYN